MSTREKLGENDPDTDESTAPRWLSGGRSGVRMRDNPTALAYNAALEGLLKLFRCRQRSRPPNGGDE